jgi:transglutaminase-like putative cysteine protease
VNDDTKKRKGLFSRAKKSKTPETRPMLAEPKWGNWQAWMNIVLLFITLEIAILSVEQAHWITPQPLLSLILIFSIVLSFVAVRIRMFGIFKHILLVVIGLVITLWQALSLIEASESVSKFSQLLNTFQSWWQGSGGSLTGDNKIIFVVFITLLTWLIGYLSTWFVLRWNNAWVAVVLGALVILFNLSNLPDSYYIYFILYFFAAALLIAVTRMTARTSITAHTANYSMGSLIYLGVSLLCITALAASFSWFTPQVRATSLQNWVSTSMPWQGDVLESKYNIFNSVPSKQSFSTAFILKDLPFGQTWNQGDDIKFVVVSERPSYWRMNVYDTYTSKGWTNSTTSKTLLEPNTPWSDNETFFKQETMKYAVINGISTDVLFTNGGFISSDIPVRVNVGAAGDVTAITALRVFDLGDRYIVTSHVSTANESDLAAAGENYPAVISLAYLQLPTSFPVDIKQLSENITQEAQTPYTKVQAIISFLSQYRYQLEISTLPEGADSVEYFLFTRKNGFCLHFASAAVTMLRSVGVPARLAVGYLPGDPGPTAGQYLLRDKYFHAWAQVYFPDYGWVDVEATPGGGESPVSVSNPWVSSPNLAESPQWDVWLGAMPPSVANIYNLNVENVLGNEVPVTDSLSFGAKLGRALLFILAAALIIVLLIGVIFIIRSLSFRWLWRVNRNAVAYGTYMNMCRLAAMVGLVPKPQQTPLEFTAELVEAFPQQSEALHYIARVYMENRFGGREGKPGAAEEAEILKARHIVYNSLIQRLGVMRRLLGKK